MIQLLTLISGYKALTRPVDLNKVKMTTLFYELDLTLNTHLIFPNPSMASMVDNLEESNINGIGSEADAAQRLAAAKTEEDWIGAGEKAGVQVWRVENSRYPDGTPNFGVNPWPLDHYGQFFAGDSFIVLHTKENKETGKLSWDCFFWIGKESSQDEYAVAAYKAVELDDLLGGYPTQHREVQEREVQ